MIQRDSYEPIQRDSHELQAELYFFREVHKGSFLLVEGDSDLRLYNKFIKKNECKVIPAYGYEGKGAKDIVFEVIHRTRVKGVLGIVDSDFSKIDGELCKEPNIVETDTHDIETLIINSSALEQIFDAFVDKSKLEQFEKETGENITEILLTNAQYIGLFVYYSNKNNLYLNFNGIEFSRFIDIKSLSINLEVLIDVVFAKSGKTLRNKEKLLYDLKKMGNNNYDKWHLCRGHDLVEILYIGIKNIFGSHKAKFIKDPKDLETDLIFAYDSISFAKTNMYRSIRQWELINSPFLICIHELSCLTN